MILGINRALARVNGSIKLIVKVEDSPQKARLNTEFVVFDSTLLNDAIIGQPLLFDLKAVVLLIEVFYVP